MVQHQEGELDEVEDDPEHQEERHLHVQVGGQVLPRDRRAVMQGPRLEREVEGQVAALDRQQGQQHEGRGAIERVGRVQRPRGAVAVQDEAAEGQGAAGGHQHAGQSLVSRCQPLYGERGRSSLRCYLP